MCNQQLLWNEKYVQNFRRPKWKRLIWIPRDRWEGNIEMDMKEMGCGIRDCFQLFQDRL
jgi:hypothetical protein